MLSLTRQLRGVRSRLWALVETTGLGWRVSLRRRYGATGPHGHPAAPWHNAVLKSREEVELATAKVRELGLPSMDEPAKNWDGLAALDLILSATTPQARIFDAGGEVYSMILPWLSMYGYRDLVAGNLAFRRPFCRGPIHYLPCDITNTAFPDDSFDAVTCLSVIEHGVDLDAYLKEMARITRPGGLLITSTDYFDEPTPTDGLTAYGVPVHVFTRPEIEATLVRAEDFGFELTGPLDLGAQDRVVCWARLGLRYTFLVMSFRLSGAAQPLGHGFTGDGSDGSLSQRGVG